MLAKLRARLTYANVMATVAVFIALGGSTYAAATISGRQLKNRSVAGSKLKKNSVTGKEVKESKLGKVPSASTASNAKALGGIPPGGYVTGSDSRLSNARTPTGAARGALSGTYPNPSLAAPEAVHLVGHPGEPAFATGASNSSGETDAGFYKDGFGIVHLQGTVSAPTGSRIFTLPAGYRPEDQIDFSVPAFVGGSTFTTNRATITFAGDVRNDAGTGDSYISLSSITFRPR